MKKTIITLLVSFSMTLSVFSQEALVIADLHFNPFYPIYRLNLSKEENARYVNRELTGPERLFIDKLLKKGLDREAPLSEAGLKRFYAGWAKVLRAERDRAAHKTGNLSLTIGENTDILLFESMLNDIKARSGESSFVLYMGDFFTHGFDDEEYNKPIVDYVVGRYGEEGFYRLKYSTMLFVLQGIRQSTGSGKPIYSTLGNSDMYKRNQYKDGKRTLKVNYSNNYTEQFKTDIVRVFDFFAGPGNRLKHWDDYTGAYSVDIKGTDITLLSMNTNYLQDTKDSSADEAILGRLIDEVAREDSENIWILMHIPPGKEVPIYEIGEKWLTPEQYWYGNATSKFTEMYRNYSERIEFSLAGHTHKSEFKLILTEDRDRALGFTMINPGVCLRSGNFPGYTLLERSGENASFAIKWDVYSVISMGEPGGYEWRPYSQGNLNRDNKKLKITWRDLLSPESDELTIYPTGANPPPFNRWWAIYNVGSPSDYERVRALTVILNSITFNNLKAGKIGIDEARQLMAGEYTPAHRLYAPIQYWTSTEVPHITVQ